MNLSSRNPFGNNAFNNALPPAGFLQPGFGPMNNFGPGFYNGNVPFQSSGAILPNYGNGMSPAFHPSPIDLPPIGPNYRMAPMPMNGFGPQMNPFPPAYPIAPQPQYSVDDPNHFGSGSYGRSRSRRSSRHRSGSRHRSRSPSTSDDERYHHRRGSPYAHQYGAFQPFPQVPVIPPNSGSPILFPPRSGSPGFIGQRPVWS